MFPFLLIKFHAGLVFWASQNCSHFSTVSLSHYFTHIMSPLKLHFRENFSYDFIKMRITALMPFISQWRLIISSQWAFNMHNKSNEKNIGQAIAWYSSVFIPMTGIKTCLNWILILSRLQHQSQFNGDWSLCY